MKIKLVSIIFNYFIATFSVGDFLKRTSEEEIKRESKNKMVAGVGNVRGRGCKSRGRNPRMSAPKNMHHNQQAPYDSGTRQRNSNPLNNECSSRRHNNANSMEFDHRSPNSYYDEGPERMPHKRYGKYDTNPPESLRGDRINRRQSQLMDDVEAEHSGRPYRGEGQRQRDNQRRNDYERVHEVASSINQRGQTFNRGYEKRDNESCDEGAEYRGRPLLPSPDESRGFRPDATSYGVTNEQRGRWDDSYSKRRYYEEQDEVPVDLPPGNKPRRQRLRKAYENGVLLPAPVREEDMYDPELPTEQDHDMSSQHEDFRMRSQHENYRTGSQYEDYNTCSQQEDCDTHLQYEDHSTRFHHKNTHSQYEDYNTRSQHGDYRTDSRYEDYNTRSHQEEYNMRSQHGDYRTGSQYDDYRRRSQNEDDRTGSKYEEYRTGSQYEYRGFGINGNRGK